MNGYCEGSRLSNQAPAWRLDYVVKSLKFVESCSYKTQRLLCICVHKVGKLLYFLLGKLWCLLLVTLVCPSQHALEHASTLLSTPPSTRSRIHLSSVGIVYINAPQSLSPKACLFSTQSSHATLVGEHRGVGAPGIRWHGRWVSGHVVTWSRLPLYTNRHTPIFCAHDKWLARNAHRGICLTMPNETTCSNQEQGSQSFTTRCSSRYAGVSTKRFFFHKASQC